MSWSHRSASSPLWIPLIVGLALRLLNIWAPILGAHSLRQADTAAIARNYLEQGLAIWLTRVGCVGWRDWGRRDRFSPLRLERGLAVPADGCSCAAGAGADSALAKCSHHLAGRPYRPAASGSRGWVVGSPQLRIAASPGVLGRTVQPEATLMLLAALCLDRALAWRDRGRLLDLFLCWLGFTGCLLVKLLPVVWLGLPLLLIFSWGLGAVQRILTRPLPWLFALSPS